MTPTLAALDHCLRLLGECKQGEVSICVSNEQIKLMKEIKVKNRVRHNLTHQLANLIATDVGIKAGIVESERLHPDHADYTQFTLRTVVMKTSTYLDLQAGLMALRGEAMVQAPDAGGFIDGNDRHVIAGDRVEYRFENHRRGVLNEALQDGDAYVTWDDGSHATVKWCNLAKIR